jgi:hypothetical protein
MRYSDIVEARRVGILAVHGTTTAFLRSILKNGMKRDPAARVWDSDSGDTDTGNLQTVGGVYWSKKWNIARDGADDAVKRFGGNPLFVFARVSEGSAFADEDNISDHVMEMFARTVASESPRPYAVKPALLRSWVDLVKQRSVINRLSGDFGRALHFRLRSSPKQPMSIPLMRELFEAYAAYLINKRRDQLDSVDDILVDLTDPRTALRNVYDRLTRYYTSTVYSDVSFRVDSDIGYGGRTRIIAVIEYHNEKWIVHYGEPGVVEKQIFGTLLPLGDLSRGDVRYVRD